MPDCLVSFGAAPDAVVDLVCIPWAGAGAAAFHAWSAVLPPAVELLATRRAGRERRLRETPTDRIGDVVAELADALAQRGPRPTVLFGHCLGAMIAFELARELRRRGQRQPQRLIVLGSSEPGRWYQPEPTGDLATWLRSYGHTGEDVLSSGRVFELLRPAIEADLRLGHRYRYEPDAPLDVPVTVLLAGVDPDERTWAAGWAAESTVRTDTRTLPPGEPYPGGTWLALASAVADEAVLVGQARR